MFQVGVFFGEWHRTVLSIGKSQFLLHNRDLFIIYYKKAALQARRKIMKKIMKKNY